jgi:biopolymer transport protein ExbB
MARDTSDDLDDDAKGEEAAGGSEESGKLIWILLAVFSPLPTVLFFLLYLGTKSDPPKDPAIRFLIGDWYFSGPMITLSLVSITLVIWRLMLNANAKTDMDEFLPHLQQVLQEEGVEAGLRACRAEQGMIPSKLFVAGMEASKQGVAAMKRAMASVLELEILPDLNFLLAPILAIAKIATMVGLLGTVISMIGTFNAISSAKGGNPSEVTAQAGAIGLALFATALGLMTAIPLVFTHVLFKDWIARFETKMKGSAQRLLILFQTLKPQQGEVKKERDKEKERDRDRGRERARS